MFKGKATFQFDCGQQQQKPQQSAVKWDSMSWLLDTNNNMNIQTLKRLRADRLETHDKDFLTDLLRTK